MNILAIKGLVVFRRSKKKNIKQLASEHGNSNVSFGYGLLLIRSFGELPKVLT